MDDRKVVIDDQEQAQEIFDFIREHLPVINDTPFVETLMIDLEVNFDLGEE